MREAVEVKIVEFDERFVKDFADLNYEWIEKAYTIEEHDREVLDHPAEQITASGGQIFFALVGDKPTGTVALIEMDAESFELAKMAVSPDFRGLGISNKLLVACRLFQIGWQTSHSPRIEYKTGRGDQTV